MATLGPHQRNSGGNPVGDAPRRCHRLSCSLNASSEPAKADDKGDKSNRLQQLFSRTKKVNAKADVNKPLPKTPPNSRPGTPAPESSGNRPGSSPSRQSSSSSNSIAETTFGDLAFDKLGSALLYIQACGALQPGLRQAANVAVLMYDHVKFIRDSPSSLERLFIDMTRLLKTLAEMDEKNHIHPDPSKLQKLLEDIKAYLDRHYTPEADGKDKKSKADGKGKRKRKDETKEQTSESKEDGAQQKKTSKDSEFCVKNWVQRIRRPKKDDKGKKSEAGCEGKGLGMANEEEIKKGNAETKEDSAQQKKSTKHSKVYSKYFAERISKKIDSYRNKLADECATLTLQYQISSHDQSMKILQKQDRMLVEQKKMIKDQNRLLEALSAGGKDLAVMPTASGTPNISWQRTGVDKR
ncbi:hypothetical protein FISHEDRAFT_59525 [Fistulina hepatica ATCC 64428]|uniref:Uncharacterized protein n=1 Tax=Fistulina hepatica ATCC 64428 TaxID=1128425 RepID=A0A0D7AAG2_9AGAR|nr:hypothetical protein FISHEDRAFT_59525 [Fistulina hepatica ATCC 64428]